MGARGKATAKIVTTQKDDRRDFKHIVVMNGKKFFVAEFFRRYELQPFEVDLDTLDDDSDFIAHLMTQLELNSWEQDKPLYYAVPGDPKLPKAEKEAIRGIIIDGRHRTWAWQLLWEKHAYSPEPKMKPFPVHSVDHAIIMRAVFELKNRGKAGAVVRRHVEKVLTAQIEKHYSEFRGDMQKAIDYFKKNSFMDETMVTKLFKKAIAKRTDPGKSGAPKSRGPTVNDSYYRQFGGKLGSGKDNATENALPAHDNGTSLDIRCPECKQGLVCPSCLKPCYLFQGDNGVMQIKHIVEAVTSS